MLTETITSQTRKWIIDVVIGCNFCPFAAREIKKDSVVFEVLENANKALVLQTLSRLFKNMDAEAGVETILLILPKNFASFPFYLKLLKQSENFLIKQGYEGVYQIASFHPHYLFSGSTADDPSNYTNRSPYPMLHILREASLTHAIDNFPDTSSIPEKNIAFTKQKGLLYMQALLKACLDIS